MDIRKIKKLVELLQESGIAEIEVKEGEESLRISRYGQALSQPVATAPLIAPPARDPEGGGREDAGAVEAPPTGHPITSPMVGTFYRAPSTGAKPFVEVGQRVNVGDAICIIEAMKIFNQIDADKAGVVAAIMVENGQAVEYGEVLFIVE